MVEKSRRKAKSANVDFGESVYGDFEMRHKSVKVMLFLEFMIYFVGFLGTLLSLTQAYSVWFSGNVQGSIVSWLALAAFTPFWILYGIMNRKFSLTMTYVVWFVSVLLVILGIYVRG